MKRYISIIVVWLLFVLAAVGGFVAGLIALVFFHKREYADNVFDAQNRATAAFFGWRGDRGVSHECGKRQCRLCRLLCRILSWAFDEPHHCEKAASE